MKCLSIESNQLWNPNLVNFISETSVEYVIFYKCRDSHSSMKMHLISSKLDWLPFTMLWHLRQTSLNEFQRIQKIIGKSSLQILRHINVILHAFYVIILTLSPRMKLGTRCLQWGSRLAHTKQLQVKDVKIYAIVFQWRHILFLRESSESTSSPRSITRNSCTWQWGLSSVIGITTLEFNPSSYLKLVFYDV